MRLLLFASGCAALTPLPRGINQYEVSAGLRANPLSTVRSTALAALAAARRQNLTLLEIEFPPLLGVRTEFEDVDNVQILDANRDWAVEACASLSDLGSELWLAFPDRKELELAREAWPGTMYAAATLTTLEDAATALSGADAVVQPLNLEACEADGSALVCLNGAFDKLRGGYYPRIFFPKLADCIDRFVSRFETIFYLKPLSDKGRSGWLFRVYPEPWQVVAQSRDSSDVVVLASETRPSYFEAIEALLSAGSSSSS
ncbi:hypothetical protein CTAYLR_003919 [Chrysophaeum taylorii]|uniref:DUF1995 domain-containing protein n=1 Tax=Chrysophaeum taylorii TaxID=2483200 RepID=A0AAD7UBL2_9STRA|nr:hypothetical protein CTAYLR_003919 [Chrysophaeum taylorii]